MKKLLIKVDTIKPSHAKQIQWVGKDNWKQMTKDIHPETGNVREAEVIAWIPGRTLRELGHVSATALGRCYLVKTPIGLFWMNAPDTGPVAEHYKKAVSQLFV